MPKRISWFQQWLEQAKVLLDEAGPKIAQASRWRRFVHFWVLVWSSFNRNRCPVRASALAYASLLALIPMLAVVISITSSILKQQGEDRINEFIGKMVASLTPPATNYISFTSNPEGAFWDTGPDQENAGTNHTAMAESPAGAQEQGAPDQQAQDTRRAVAQKINEFIQNTRSGALGVTGSVVLIFAAISLLSRIETTFNDIWGVERGRSWFMRIVLYWGVLTLVPILLVVALGLATGPHLQTTQDFIASLPFVGNFLVSLGFVMLPIVLLCLTFGAFYMLMPNTRVHWGAALVGGLVAGLLFYANNMVSVLYVSRVVSNSKIYGSLGLVPVLMIGLYLAWLIVLLGAQVAYAFQNRAVYAEERQVENINQRGREFIALRLMTVIGQRFVKGEPPLSVADTAEELSVPTRLVQQIMHTLASARLVVEIAGGEIAYVPARPIETITCYDILEAMRAAYGQELATRDEPTRLEVYGEFQRIQEAERRVAASVSMLALVHRAQAQLESGQSKAIAPAPS